METTHTYRPAEGSGARAAWDRLTEEKRQFCDEWISGSVTTEAIDALSHTPAWPVVMRALGY